MNLLGVGFLQQGAPELVVGGGVKQDEPVPHRRQPVVHHDVQPLVVVPELRWEQRMSHQKKNKKKQIIFQLKLSTFDPEHRNVAATCFFTG